MHIIVVSSRLANTRSMTLTGAHLLAGGFAAAAMLVGLAVVLLYFTVRYAAELKLPILDSALASVQEQEARKTEGFLRENLNAMAIKLGQMQAQLVRLDALGERVSTLAGLRPGEFRFSETPGRGGALPASLHRQNLSLVDLSRQVDALSRHLDNRTDDLGILETALFDAQVKKRLLPTVTPVDASWSASSFGWRIDPFTGENALHEGIDFIADVGTPIFAAAAGVVVLAEEHHQYGKVVEIDHGNDFVTRYAHASKLLVRPGQVVQRGRKIAEVGSTGRSTGPHLHFEVRYRGIAQNPAKFLRAAAG
jgi:murein DD-endopeptidase MepM/ murein hydrolase activator NlpD